MPSSAKSRSTVAVLGGTFDHLHRGHRALLAAAFARADDVRIGLTSDRFVESERKPLADRMQSYPVRRRHLRAFLLRRFKNRAWSIVPLNDSWGGSVGPGIDLLVLSEETQRVVRAINAERTRRGLSPVRTHVVSLVVAKDGLPIASRRIRSGEIDSEGRVVRAATPRRLHGPSTKT